MIKQNIKHHQIHVPANKNGEITVTQDLMNKVLAVVLNADCHPLLIHCNQGKVSKRRYPYACSHTDICLASNRLRGGMLAKGPGSLYDRRNLRIRDIRIAKGPP